MGKPVTIDSDDLEKLIFLTGAVKKIEQLMYNRQDDPFLCKDQTVIAEAHDRIAAEYRRATRTMPADFNDPISEKAFTLLKSLDGDFKQIDHQTMKIPLYQELFKKLHIEYGNGYEVIYWSNTQQQQNLNDIAKLMVRVTPRGRALIAEMAAKESAVTN